MYAVCYILLCMLKAEFYLCTNGGKNFVLATQ
jgi:hypothetical protein